MKIKKPIDRLFREHMKSLDTAPPDAVWDHIKATLQKKKKKRAAPLWYKLAGVAATLLLLIGISNFFVSQKSINPITVEDNFNENHSPESKINSDQTNTIVETQPVQKNTPSKQDYEISTNQKEKSTDKTVQQKKTPIVITPKNTAQKEDLALQNNRQNLPVEIVQSKDNKEKATNQNKITETPFLEQDILEETQTDVAHVDENKKSLLDYLKEKQEEKETATNSSTIMEDRWSISPSIGPVYYNSIAGGSSIDAQFSKNPISGDVNYSYGIQLSYAINHKLSIRTGLNKVDVGYATQNIEFAVATPSEALQSISYKNSNYIVAVGKRGTLNPPSSGLPTVTDGGQIIVPRSGVIPGILKQEIDYFEIPMELKYRMIDKKIGLNLIGGMSTLLLNRNDVIVSSDGFSSTIGSATNLNPLSFSTNIGLGIDYKFTQKFTFNLEPMFKYQLNPYNDSTIDFKPYILGIYTGFSFKF